MNDRSAAAQSGVWSVVLQWSRFGLNTLVFLILARWLSLSEIGAFAIAFAPINLLQLVQRSGISETVVQGQTEIGSFTDTVFWISVAFGLAMSLCIFSLSFAISPFIEPGASVTYLAAMAVIPGLVGVAAVPEGLLRRRLEIRTLALRTTASLTVAGMVALWLGYTGYGGWALTAFAIVNALLSSVLVILLVRWRPGGTPRCSEARKAVPVLMAISGRALANGSIVPILQLMVGAALGPVAAGAFQIAQRFLTLAETVTLTPLRFAALPVFMQVRGDAARLGRVVIEVSGLVSFVSAPVYFGLLALSPILLPLAVGEENGTAATPALQALLLLGGHLGLYAVFTQSLTAIGRSDVVLRWSILLFALNIGIGALTVMHSVVLAALGYSLLGYVAAPFVLKELSTRIGISKQAMSRAVFGPVAAAAAMAIAVLVFGSALAGNMSNLMLLALEIAIGVVIYASLSLLISRSQISKTRSLLATLLPRHFPT